jgi:hypothetical protein
MRAFTIDAENNITVHSSAKEAKAVPNSERFGNEAALAKLAAEWPAARLVEIYNSLPGETPVRKFKDRATAASRIWKAIQGLGDANPATEEPALVPEMAPSGEIPETASVPEEQASETDEPKAVIPEPTERAGVTTVAPQTPDVAPEEAPAKNKATRTKRRPRPRHRRMVAHPAKAARPVR